MIRKVDLRKRQTLSERHFIGHAGGQHGPMQLTVRVERVDGCRATTDGWHRASYFVHNVDGQMFGGVADHLPADGVPHGVHGVEVEAPAVEVEHVEPLDLDPFDTAVAQQNGFAAALRFRNVNDPGDVDPAVRPFRSGDRVTLPTGFEATVVVVEGDRVLCRIGQAAAWFRSVEVEHVDVDPNPVRTVSVEEASRLIVEATGADLDPEEIAFDLSSGSSFSVEGHGRVYRPNGDGTVSVFVDLSKPSDLPF